MDVSAPDFEARDRLGKAAFDQRIARLTCEPDGRFPPNRSFGDRNDESRFVRDKAECGDQNRARSCNGEQFLEAPN